MADKIIPTSKPEITLKAEDIKIGTKEEALWTSVQKNLTQTITNLEKELTVNKAFLELALKKVELEQKKK